MDKSYLKSAPLKLDDLLLLDPPKPSKKLSKGSESEPKISEKTLEKSKFEKPPLPPVPSKAA